MEQISRDCQHKRVKHAHGTLAAYRGDKCRCFKCRLANSRANTARSYGGQRVPSIGAQRRVQALAAIGWSCEAIAQAGGIAHMERVHYMRSGYGTGWMYLASFDRVVAAYEKLSMTPAPYGHGSNRVRSLAAARGWPPPLAWDDETIDSPDAVPQALHEAVLDEVAISEALAGRAVVLTRAERAEAVRSGTERGMTAAQLSALLRTTDRNVVRIRSKAAA